MIETCSCAAALEITNVGEWSMEALLDVFKDWRKNHIHEMPAAPADPPLIHESSSFHERVADEHPAQGRALIGFQRNEVR